MFNETIVVSVTPFSGTTTPDKNGERSVMLQCLAGRMPNRNVLSGTVASRMGIEVGKTYLMNVRESGFDKQFGADFTFTKIKELEAGLDIAKTIKELGPAEILTIARPEGYEKTYQRKGDAVEGLRTKRIKEGLYEPVTASSYEHSTAKDIIEGSSASGEKNPNQGLSPEDALRTA
jgi:hypothetical protein